MAFRKAVFAKAFDLAETARGEIRWIAAPGHAVDEFDAEAVDGADAPKRRHGAAQAIGLGGRKFRRHDRNAHRLFLEQRHAERLVQHLLQFVFVAMQR